MRTRSCGPRTCHASQCCYGPLTRSAVQQTEISGSDKALIDTITRFAAGLVLLGIASAGVSETDIWGHLAIGLDMLRTGHFLWVDPYSFTHDQPWINHEWLWDVLAA